MTLHSKEIEVGVRELHDRLSGYLEKVEEGTELIVTRRGKRIARMSQIDASRPFEELERRGLVRWPKGQRKPRKASIKSQGSVSDLVAEQRR